MEELLSKAVANEKAGSTGKVSSKLGMHKDSHAISKLKPKIRIIHIFAPEIIKTDVQNFRELVQRLTGKPSADRRRSSSSSSPSKKKLKKLKQQPVIPTKNLTSSSFTFQEYSSRVHHDSMLNFNEVPSLFKVEENDNGSWEGGHDGSSSSSGNFFDGFIDLDGFIQELSDGFPSPIPVKSSQSNYMDLFQSEG